MLHVTTKRLGQTAEWIEEHREEKAVFCSFWESEVFAVSSDFCSSLYFSWSILNLGQFYRCRYYEFQMEHTEILYQMDDKNNLYMQNLNKRW